MNKTIFAVTLIFTNISTFAISKMFFANSNPIAMSQETSPHVSLIDSYYETLNTPPSESTSQTLASILAQNWFITPSFEGGNAAANLVQNLTSQYNTIPNIKTNVEEIIYAGNRLVVKTIITGTPSGQFMGVNTNGTKSFSIPAVDIHTIQDGKISQTQHTANWSSVVSQLQESALTPITTYESTSTQIQNVSTMQTQAQEQIQMQVQVDLQTPQAQPIQ